SPRGLTTLVEERLKALNLHLGTFVLEDGPRLFAEKLEKPELIQRALADWIEPLIFTVAITNAIYSFLDRARSVISLPPDSPPRTTTHATPAPPPPHAQNGKPADPQTDPFADHPEIPAHLRSGRKGRLDAAPLPPCCPAEPRRAASEGPEA